MDRYLKANYYKRTARQIAERQEDSKAAVLRGAKKLSIEKISKHLNRSPDAVRQKANRMNLLTATKINPFTQDELNFLTENITSMSYREIAAMLGRVEEQTRWYARRLGLKRPRS